jgi:hypothetical protein
LVNPTLVNYIKEQVKAGYEINTIKYYLIKNGYNQEQVNSAINEINSSGTVPGFESNISDQKTNSIKSFSNTKIIVLVLAVICIISLLFGVYYIASLSKPKAQDDLINLQTNLISKEVSKGDTLEFNVILNNVGKSKNVDVNLKYEIIGTKIFKSEKISVSTKKEITSSIEIPDDIVFKTYTLKVSANYGLSKVAFSSFRFNVKKSLDEKQEEMIEEKKEVEVHSEEKTKPNTQEQIPTTKCVENWQCDNWNPNICPESGTQTRTCVEKNKCLSELNKPETSKTCEYWSKEETVYTNLEKNEMEKITIWERLELIKKNAKANPTKAIRDCESFFDTESHKDECYYNVAEMSSSYAICNKISSERTKDKCISNIAKITDNNLVCDKIEKQARKDSCYMIFVQKKDFSVCEKIENSYLKEVCTAMRDHPEFLQ